MKKEQIFGKYFGKPLDIQGFNLPERQGVKFYHKEKIKMMKIVQSRLTHIYFDVKIIKRRIKYEF